MSQGPDDGLSNEARGMRAAAPYVAAVWRLVGGCVVGAGGGWAVDKWLGSGPWGLVVGTLAGLAAGFVGLMKGLSEAERQKKARGR